MITEVGSEYLAEYTFEWQNFLLIYSRISSWDDFPNRFSSEIPRSKRFRSSNARTSDLLEERYISDFLHETFQQELFCLKFKPFKVWIQKRRGKHWECQGESLNAKTNFLEFFYFQKQQFDSESAGCPTQRPGTLFHFDGFKQIPQKDYHADLAATVLAGEIIASRQRHSKKDDLILARVGRVERASNSVSLAKD